MGRKFVLENAHRFLDLLVGQRNADRFGSEGDTILPLPLLRVDPVELGP